VGVLAFNSVTGFNLIAGAGFATFSVDGGSTRSLTIGQIGGNVYISAATTASETNNLVFRTADASGVEQNAMQLSGTSQSATFYGDVFVSSGKLLRANGRLEIKAEYTEAIQSYTVTVGAKNINIDNGTYAYPAAAMTAVAVTFTFSGPQTGSLFSWMLELNIMVANTSGTPFPAAVPWGDAGIPTWTAGVQVVCFWTRDGGATIHGALAV